MIIATLLLTVGASCLDPRTTPPSTLRLAQDTDICVLSTAKPLVAEIIKREAQLKESKSGDRSQIAKKSGALAEEPPILLASPLLIELERLEKSPAEVKYIVIKRAGIGSDITFQQFSRVNPESMKRMAREAYYIMSFERAMLLTDGDSDLVDILNRFGKPNSSFMELSLEFEKLYYKKFRVMPKIVPVDVRSLIEKILYMRKVQ
jgi:hypothetical protein